MMFLRKTTIGHIFCPEFFLDPGIEDTVLTIVGQVAVYAADFLTWELGQQENIFQRNFYMTGQNPSKQLRLFLKNTIQRSGYPGVAINGVAGEAGWFF